MQPESKAADNAATSVMERFCKRASPVLGSGTRPATLQRLQNLRWGETFGLMMGQNSGT
jgi:hypothetical protein